MRTLSWRTVPILLLLPLALLTAQGGSAASPPLSAASPPPPGIADTTDLHRVSLDEALALFHQNNLTLQRADAQAAEETNRARQELAYPNPELEVSHEPLFRGSEQVWEAYAVLHQRIEWPGHRSTQRRAADHARDAAYAAASADSLRAAYDVAQAYVDAAKAETELDALQTALYLFQDANAAAQRRYDEGDLSGYALQRFQVDYTRYAHRIADAELEVEATRRTLNRLILPEERSPTAAPTALPESSPEHLALNEALARAANQRPALTRIRAEIDAARATQRVAEQTRIPEPTLMAGYKRQSDGFEGLFIGAEIPLPAFDRNSPRIRAEHARAEAAETTRRMLEQEIEDEVRTAHAAFVSLTERRTRLDTTRADPEALLTSARSRYNEGELPVTDLIDAAEAYVEIRTATAELHAEQWRRYLDLLRAMGQPL